MTRKQRKELLLQLIEEKDKRIKILEDQLLLYKGNYLRIVHRINTSNENTDR